MTFGVFCLSVYFAIKMNSFVAIIDYYQFALNTLPPLPLAQLVVEIRFQAASQNLSTTDTFCNFL